MSEESILRDVRPDPLAEFGKVAGELVHDLANDMQVLQGWAALARAETEMGQVPADEIQRVSRMAEGLGRMLQDVLATVAGQAISPEVTFDPRALTELTVNDRLSELALGDVRLRISLPAGTQVAGRASFWIRIIVNLLRNASRHARSRVLISVQLEQQPDGGGAVLLRIEDDGPGVPIGQRETVFEPLVRGNHGGAGLGLSSVAWSVEQLRGSVGYAPDSSLGGAAFEVRVPTAGTAVVAAPRAAEVSVLCGLKLLLIDDDPSIRAAIARLLRREGADVREIDPGSLPEEQLVQDVMSALPDGILIDLHLRDRGGVSVWERIREDLPQLADRVLFISGSAPGDPMWEDAQQTGRPVLAKPFEIRQLIALVERLPRG